MHDWFVMKESMDDLLQFPGVLSGPRTLWDPWENRVINDSPLRLLDVDSEPCWVPVIKSDYFLGNKNKGAKHIITFQTNSLIPKQVFLKTHTMCLTLWRDVMNRAWKGLTPREWWSRVALGWRLCLPGTHVLRLLEYLRPAEPAFSVLIIIFLPFSLTSVTLVKWFNEKYVSLNINLVYFNSGCTCQIILRLCLLPVS